MEHNGDTSSVTERQSQAGISTCELPVDLYVLPASFSQQRMWFLHELWPDSAAYNVPVAIRLEGQLNHSHLQTAVDAVVRRHETLRTNFAVENQEVVQLIRSRQHIPLRVVDLSDLPDIQRRDRAYAIANEIAQQPFDLGNAPLLRVGLIQLTTLEHVLVVVLHHIISDEWSIANFFDELNGHLRALDASGKAAELPELEIQYADFAQWQRERIDNLAIEKQLAYWKQHFSTPAPVLELPLDHRRPTVQTTRGSHCQFTLPATETTQLVEFARQHRATLFHIIATAYSILLYRYSGQTDLVLGFPTANRQLPELEPLIGLFLNTVMLRCDLTDRPSPAQLIARTRQSSFDALANQEVPFERLVEELKPERDPSRPALFQTMVTFQSTPFVPPSLPGCRAEWAPLDRGAARFDLSLYCELEGPQLIGEFEYNADLFAPETVQRMSMHLTNLFRQLPLQSQTPIDSISILDDSEQQDMLAQPAPFSWPDASLVDLLRSTAGRFKDKTAISCAGERLSYMDLEQRSDRLARLLLQRGCGPGTLVGLCVDRCPSMVTWLLAIWKSGAAYLPIDPTFPLDRRQYIVTDSQAQILITSTDYRDDFDNFNGEVILADSLASQELEVTDDLPAGDRIGNPDAAAYVIYTSGSTGKPKGVVIPHRAVKNFLLSMAERPGLSSADCLLSITTLSFDISVLEVFLPLLVGAELAIATRDQAIDGHLLAQALTDTGATVMQGTPASWQLLLESGWRGKRNLKMLCGGEALPRQLALSLLAQGSELWNLYGPTETTVWSTVAKIDPQRLEDDQNEILLGEPIANTSLYVLNSGLQPVPIGVAGQLYIGGDGLALGYHRRNDLTRERFISNPYRPGEKIYATGDLVRRMSDGGLQFLGRDDHQVKIRGFRIELGEIEQALMQQSTVKQAVVIAKDQDALGNRHEPRLVAYLVASAPESQTHSPDNAALRTALNGILPDYMVPAHYVWLDEIPQTPNRKVDRNRLPEPEPENVELTCESFRRASDDLEQQLVNIWQSVLGLRKVGVDQDFFQLGGHSLAAARMMRELEKANGERLPLALLLQYPTIETLAAQIRDQGGRPQWESLVPISAGGSKTPLYCIHAAGGNVLLYRELAQLLGEDRPIYGLQSEALAGALPKSDSIEEIASRYVAEIRKIQPRGVYNLCGYCLGGTIAYEIAQQLRHSGGTIGTLALFDTHSRWLNYNFLQQTYANWQQLYFHLANIALSGPSGVAGFLSEKFTEAKRRASRRARARTTRWSQAMGWRKSDPVHVLDGFYDEASAAYIPLPFDGPMTVFKPKAAYVGYESDSLGWADLVSQLNVVQLPVYPAGMLLRPFVEEVAAELAQALDSND